MRYVEFSKLEQYINGKIEGMCEIMTDDTVPLDLRKDYVRRLDDMFGIMEMAEIYSRDTEDEGGEE